MMSPRCPAVSLAVSLEIPEAGANELLLGLVLMKSVLAPPSAWVLVRTGGFRVPGFRILAFALSVD